MTAPAPAPPPHDDDARWPFHRGEMARRITAFDWSSTPLGPTSGWPACIRTTVDVMLRSPVAMALRWGTAGVMLYNDGYARFAGLRHPSLLGSCVRDAWPEVDGFGAAALDAVLAGATLSYRDQPFTLQRASVAEAVWLDLDYSPVLDASGGIGGMLAIVTETTARVTNECALRRERDRGRQVLDSMGEGFVLLDPEFRVVEVNAETVRMERRPAADLVGRTHWDAWPGTEHIRVGRAYRRAMAERVPVAFEHRYETAAGDVRIEVRAYPFDDGLAVFYRDATRRRAVEDALQASEAHHRRIVELNPQVIWTATPDGEFDHVGARWLEWTGLSGLGSSWRDALLPEDWQPTIDAWARAVASGAPYDVEHRLRMTDGTHRWMHSRASAHHDVDGAIVRWYGATEDIDERKAAEAALAESERRARRVSDSIDQMIWSARADGHHDYFNARWYAYTGVPVGSTDGDRWTALLHAEDRDRVLAEWRRSLASGRPYEVRYRMRHRSGDDRWVLGRAQPDAGRDGRVARWYGTCTDIDAQVRAEQALRDSEARLRETNADLERRVAERAGERSRTWQVTPDLLTVVDHDGRLHRTNPAWQTTLGWPADVVDGQPFMTFVHPDDVERTVAQWERVRDGEPVLRFENRFRTVDGSYRWLSWVAVAEDDAIYSSGRDVTDDRVRAADLLARTAERDRLWRNSQDLQVVVDGRGTFVAVNPAFTAVLGWCEHEVVGRGVFDFIAPQDVDATVGALARARGDTLPTFENRYRHKAGGVRWISWVAAPEGDLIYASGRHVTAEKEQAAALAVAQDALRQSQKMDAVGQLTGGIAHDFNNMLAVVIGSLDLLARRIGQDDPKIRRYVDSAMDGAKRAALLTQRLLAFSRQQPLQPEPLDANRLVAGMSDLLGHSLGASIALETVLAGDLWRTFADPNQLEGVLLNLVVNARDAMPDGGRLTIATRNAAVDAHDAARDPAVPAGPYVLITVADTGSGMSAEVAAKAFEPFFTTKAVGKGTGLGLSQVYGFVEQSSGHVKLRSELGHGTTVEVYLPWHAGAAIDAGPGDASVADRGDARAGASADALAGPAAGAWTVLVVEDEWSVRRFSVDALTMLGYRVLEADGAAVALRLIEARPDIALLFTDIVMPETNGARLAAEATRLRPDLKVLFTTGYTRNAVVHDGVVDAGVHLIGKPFTIDDLGAKVIEVLGPR